MHRYRRNRRTISRILTGLLIVGLSAASGGCGDDRLPTTAVGGKVLYQGEPLQFGSVMFRPDAGPLARGAIRSDGTFRLSTYGNNDGAVIGKHRVRITCFESKRPETTPPDSNEEPGVGRSLIPRKYLSFDTSGLQVEVRSDNEPFVFELTD